MVKKSYSKNKSTCKVTFSLPVAEAGEGVDIRVLGTFNDWSWENGLAMKPSKGNYTASTELAAGQDYEYRYLVNNATWLNDEQADGYVNTSFYSRNCLLRLDAPPAAEAKPKQAPAKKIAAAKPAAETTAKKNAGAKPASDTTTKKSTAATTKQAPKAKGATPTAAPLVDDLKRIEGIGPKLEQMLHAEGITSFSALAKAKPATLRGILDKAGPRFKMHDPASWSQQASLAAKGDWSSLDTLQKDLKGGRRK